MDLDLLSIELSFGDMMTEDMYCESGIFGILETLINGLKEIISTMKLYADNIKADIKSIVNKQAMKKKLMILKQKAKMGYKVKIPDFKKIEEIYADACATLPKELKKLLKEAEKIKSEEDVIKFQKRKDKFEENLGDFESEIEDIIGDAKIYPANKAYQMIDQLLTTNNVFISHYYKAIRDFELFEAEYEKALRDIKRYTDNFEPRGLYLHKSMVAKTSSTLSKTLKKAVFCVCAVVL